MLKEAAELACVVLGVMCAAPVEKKDLPPGTVPENYYALPKAPKAAPTPPPPPIKPAKLDVSRKVNFGVTQLGRSKVQLIILKNAGGRPLGVGYTEVSGPDAFQVSGSCPAIDPGRACRLELRFTPRDAGEAVGTLLVGWGKSVTRVTLRGKGFEPAKTVKKEAPPPPKVVKRKAPPPPKIDHARLRALADADRALEAELVQPVRVFNRRLKDYAGAATLPRPEDAAWKLSDPNYGGVVDPSKFKGDQSTLPVERCRILSGDDFIPLVLAHMINSQIGGRIMAHVDRDVFGADGRLVLIPKGTKFRGEFEPLQKQGDSRLSATWTRLTRPDGASVSLTKTAAIDAMGRTGLTGDVDNRFFEKYGTVIGATAISAAIAFATQTNTDDDADSTFSQAGESVTQSLGQVTAEALREAANLAPRVTVAKGTLVFANPGRDWYFPSAYQVVSLGSRPPKLSVKCNGDFFRDKSGIVQNQGRQ